MLLSEDEFFDNKEAIVGEVLEKLRSFAKHEAELLFQEFETHGGALPDVSEVVSNCINRTTDALSSQLDKLTPKELELLLPLFRDHLPATIVQMGFDDRVHDQVPAQYIKNAISSCLASKIVYKEGTKFIEGLPQDQLSATALRYIDKEQEVTRLLDTIEASDMDIVEKERIWQLLAKGGTRTALQFPE